MYKLLFNYNGGHDLAGIMNQLYVYMATTYIEFPFNSRTYSFSFWECFIVTLVFSISVDVLIFGFHVIIRRL